MRRVMHWPACRCRRERAAELAGACLPWLPCPGCRHQRGERAGGAVPAVLHHRVQPAAPGGWVLGACSGHVRAARQRRRGCWGWTAGQAPAGGSGTCGRWRSGCGGGGAGDRRRRGSVLHAADGSAGHSRAEVAPQVVLLTPRPMPARRLSAGRAVAALLRLCAGHVRGGGRAAGGAHRGAAGADHGARVRAGRRGTLAAGRCWVLGGGCDCWVASRLLGAAAWVLPGAGQVPAGGTGLRSREAGGRRPPGAAQAGRVLADALLASRVSRAHRCRALPTAAPAEQVGLVTFGTHVHVHELGFTDCPKAYVFRGSKDYTPQQVQEQLGLHSAAAQRRAGPGSPLKAAGPGAPGARPGNRFILPLSECEFVINQALDELQRDAFPAVAASRPSRALGTAVQVRLACAARGAGPRAWLVLAAAGGKHAQHAGSSACRLELSSRQPVVEPAVGRRPLIHPPTHPPTHPHPPSLTLLPGGHRAHGRLPAGGQRRGAPAAAGGRRLHRGQRQGGGQGAHRAHPVGLFWCAVCF